MRRLILGLAFLLCIPPVSASSNDAAWRADMDHLRAELPRVHVDPFTRITRETFEAELSELRDSVPSLADHEVVVELMRIVAMIGDSHTSLWGMPRTQFPVDLQWLSDGFYVIRTMETHRDLLGARLIAVDTTPIADLFAAVADLIPHENDYWLRELAPRQLVAAETLHALGVIPTLDIALFRFQRSDGTISERLFERLPRGVIPMVEQMPSDQKPLYLRNVAANYWYEYLPPTGTLYVQYNRCAEIASRPIAAFASELAALARSRPVSKLVLDLRHNGGGDSGLIVPMLMDLYLAAPHLDEAERFFVVIGPATFSSAMMNAIELDTNTHATLIGLPTGGKPNHYGNVRTFTLPRSGIVLQYSTQRYDLVDGDPAALMPEIEIPITSADYFAGRDPVMRRLVPQMPRRRAISH